MSNPLTLAQVRETVQQRIEMLGGMLDGADDDWNTCQQAVLKDMAGLLARCAPVTLTERENGLIADIRHTVGANIRIGGDAFLVANGEVVLLLAVIDRLTGKGAT